MFFSKRSTFTLTLHLRPIWKCAQEARSVLVLLPASKSQSYILKGPSLFYCIFCVKKISLGPNFQDPDPGVYFIFHLDFVGTCANKCGCPQRPEEGTVTSGAGLKGCCELLDWSAEHQTSLLYGSSNCSEIGLNLISSAPCNSIPPPTPQANQSHGQH